MREQYAALPLLLDPVLSTPAALQPGAFPCPKCGKATRVAHRKEEITREDGTKKTKTVRVCKRCKADID